MPPKRRRKLVKVNLDSPPDVVPTCPPPVDCAGCALGASDNQRSVMLPLVPPLLSTYGLRWSNGACRIEEDVSGATLLRNLSNDVYKVLQTEPDSADVDAYLASVCAYARGGNGLGCEFGGDQRCGSLCWYTSQPGVLRASRCRAHALLDWRFALRPRCVTCSAPARYGTQWLRPRHCAIHMEPGEAICIYVCLGCKQQRALYGTVWKQPTHCAACTITAPGARWLVSKPRCAAAVSGERCPWRFTKDADALAAAELGDEVTPTAAHAAASGDARRQQMIQNPTDEKLRWERPWFGLGGVHKPIYCATHAPVGYAEATRNCVERADCRRPPHFGVPHSAVALRCALHQRDGDVNVRRFDVCIVCGHHKVAMAPLSICPLCASSTWRLHGKVPPAELTVLRYLGSTMPTDNAPSLPPTWRMVWNAETCGATMCVYRPDLLFLDCARQRYIVVDVDERSHSGEKGAHERGRMLAIQAALNDKPCVFVRYNPHSRKRGLAKSACIPQEQRMPVLEHLLELLYAGDIRGASDMLLNEPHITLYDSSRLDQPPLEPHHRRNPPGSLCVYYLYYSLYPTKALLDQRSASAKGELNTSEIADR